MRWSESQIAAKGYRPNGERMDTRRSSSGGVAVESDLHKSILAYCRQKRWPVVHSRMDVPQTAGVGTPDFVIALPGGRTVWVEAKASTGKLSAAQSAWLAALDMVDHECGVVRSMEEFMEMVYEKAEREI